MQGNGNTSRSDFVGIKDFAQARKGKREGSPAASVSPLEAARYGTAKPAPKDKGTHSGGLSGPINLADLAKSGTSAKSTTPGSVSTGRKEGSKRSPGPLSLADLAKSGATGGQAGMVAYAARTVAKNPIASTRQIANGQISNNKTINRAAKTGVDIATGGATRAIRQGLKTIDTISGKTTRTKQANNGVSHPEKPTSATPSLADARTGSASKQRSLSKDTKVSGTKEEKHRSKLKTALLILIVLSVVTSPLVVVAAIVVGIAASSSNGFSATPTELTSANKAIPSAWLTADQKAGRQYDVPWPLLAGIEYSTTDFGTQSPYVSGVINNANIGGDTTLGEGQGPVLLSNNSPYVTGDPYNIPSSANSLAHALSAGLRSSGINMASFSNDPFNTSEQKTVEQVLSQLPINVGPCIAAANGGATPTYPWQCAAGQSGSSSTPLAATIASLPNGSVGQSYSAHLVATGGVPPYNWSLSSGSLPPGLSVQGQQILGTPTKAGTYSFSVTVGDASVPKTQTASQSLSIVINAPTVTTPVVSPLSITTTYLPDSASGVVYGPLSLTATGGTAPYTWSISAKTPLPEGLKLDSTKGTISGTPSCTISSTAVYPITIQITDASSPPHNATVTIPLTNDGAYSSAAACITRTSSSTGSSSSDSSSSSTGSSSSSSSTGSSAISTTADIVPNVSSPTALLDSLFQLDAATVVTVANAPRVPWSAFSNIAYTEAQSLIGDSSCNSSVALDALTTPSTGSSSAGSGGISTSGNPLSVTLTNNWVTDLLSELGYPSTPQNIEFIQAWIQAETHGWADGISEGQPGVHTSTGDGGKFNPISTTLHWPQSGAAGQDRTNTVPSTDYGGAGQNGGDPVQNYNSFYDGVWATAKTLLNAHYYSPLQNALKAGNSAIADAEAESQTPWGTGLLILRVLEDGGPSAPLQGANWLGPSAPPAEYTDGIPYNGPAPKGQLVSLTSSTGASNACSVQATASDATNGGVGTSIAKLALSQLGNTNNSGIYGPTGEAWCALFTSWVWGHSGVNIPSMAFTGSIYTWGQANSEVYPPSATPQVGDALIYGTGPQSTATSLHVNIVISVLPNGEVMTVGGNQANGQVTENGPFSISNASNYMGMPIYAIVAP